MYKNLQYVLLQHEAAVNARATPNEPAFTAQNSLVQSDSPTSSHRWSPQLVHQHDEWNDKTDAGVGEADNHDAVGGDDFEQDGGLASKALEKATRNKRLPERG
jgi:hypothetical protein